MEGLSSPLGKGSTFDVIFNKLESTSPKGFTYCFPLAKAVVLHLNGFECPCWILHSWSGEDEHVACVREDSWSGGQTEEGGQVMRRSEKGEKTGDKADREGREDVIRWTDRRGRTGDQTDRQARDDWWSDGQIDEGWQVIRRTDRRGMTGDQTDRGGRKDNQTDRHARGDRWSGMFSSYALKTNFYLNIERQKCLL